MIEVYHGSPVIVEVPDLTIRSCYTKDFGWGFYCTRIKKQARIWAARKRGKDNKSFLNIYALDKDKMESLGKGYKKFEVDPVKEKRLHDAKSNKWLDFVASCRSETNRNAVCHDYDIVEGPVSDDQLWNHVTDFLGGKISRVEFWDKASFQYMTN